MKSVGVLFLVVGLLSSISYAGNDGHGGDIACQNRIEVIRNNLEERIKDGSTNTLDFTGTGTTPQQYSQRIPKIIDLTRNQQSSISCTSNPKDVPALVGGTWVPICAAEWLDGKTVKPEDRTRPKILCYTGQETNGVYTGGLMGMSGNEQYGQIDHEFNVLAGVEDQKREYSHYLIASRVSEKAQTTITYLWPAESGPAVTPEAWSFGYRYCVLSADDLLAGPSSGMLCPQGYEGTGQVVCDKPVENISVGDALTCFGGPGATALWGGIFQNVQSGIFKNIGVTNIDTSVVFNLPILHMKTNFIDNGPTEEIPQNYLNSDLENQLPYVSTEHPLAIVHDIQNGIWSIKLQ